MKKINSTMKLSNNLSFIILIFAILKFWNIDRYISSFQILTPTPVGVQIFEDVPGEVLVVEGIQVSEDIRVPEHLQIPEMFGYSTEKTWNYSTRPDPKKCCTRTPLLKIILVIVKLLQQGRNFFVLSCTQN